MNKLKITQKEYKKLSLLLINTIEKALIFLQAPIHGEFSKKNNKSIALNILHVPYNIGNAYKSEYNFELKNQVILLMITDGKKWYYLTVKSLSALFRGITSKLKKHIKEC